MNLLYFANFTQYVVYRGLINDDDDDDDEQKKFFIIVIRSSTAISSDAFPVLLI